MRCNLCNLKQKKDRKTNNTQSIWSHFFNETINYCKTLCKKVSFPEKMLCLVTEEMKNESFVKKQVDKDQITTVKGVQN